MNIYVSGLLHDPLVPWLMDVLRDNGHEITFDWTVHEPGVTMEPAALAEAEREGVWNADVLVVCNAGGGGVGTWVEIGLALSHHIPVLLWGDCRKSLFWELPEVHAVAGGVDNACDLWLPLVPPGDESAIIYSTTNQGDLP